MTPFNIALLFCRLLSIWCVVRFVEAFGRATPYLLTFVISNPSNNHSDGLSNVGIALGMSLMGCVLWLGAPIIARFLARDIEYSNSKENQLHAMPNWWNIGRGLLALYFLINGLSGLLSAITYLAFTPSAGSSLQYVRNFYFGLAVASLVYVSVAILLLFCVRRDMEREASTPLSTYPQDAS
jgi:hypothetical protein